LFIFELQKDTIMNDDISNIAGTVTHYIQEAETLDLTGLDYGIGRIVVLSDAEITVLEEQYIDNDPSSPTYNQTLSQDVSFGFESGTNQIGQNVAGKVVPAGAILCPKRAAFSKVTLLSGLVELHLLMPQKYTSRKYPAE
jgi:hypothetical protein